ncbi:hypothetical protein BU16DRAFT_568270 [Lophium mytilinum]|uniref:DNA2/NAM7 helicase helicase domain-containing protein n=1 Tax=Lophium mytilinum TaxID=390894 RepID=A0A6A6Q7M9_9PEZI|nr:hypothetical protein BU16DRAFT_568270 [Lophium mytilinum]
MSAKVRRFGFDASLIVLDEASQISNADTALNMTSRDAERLVVAGDPNQLSPTVTNMHGSPLTSLLTGSTLEHLISTWLLLLCRAATVRRTPAIRQPIGQEVSLSVMRQA